MRLPYEEVERFYRIWFELLHYVNAQLHIVPTFPRESKGEPVSTEVVRQIRDALWANDDVRNRFIADNPAQLSATDLALVDSWQYRVAGEFTIFRSLKSHTIFLSGTKPVHAYGVLGLVSVIEETLPYPLPLYVDAVLLPFEHHIIYDSLLLPYPVMLGSGIRQGLQETYRMLQEREGIITNLLPADQMGDQREGIATRNRKVFTAFRRDLGKSGLSPRMIEVHAETIEDFARSCLLEAEPPRGILELTEADVQAYLSSHPGKQPIISFKRFTRFLLNTGRIDYSVGEDLRSRLS